MVQLSTNLYRSDNILSVLFLESVLLDVTPEQRLFLSKFMLQGTFWPLRVPDFDLSEHPLPCRVGVAKACPARRKASRKRGRFSPFGRSRPLGENSTSPFELRQDLNLLYTTWR